MFITFEGLDFCGKSTQVKLLEKYLLNQGKKVLVIREPGGTEISEKIRTILLDKKNSNLAEEAELLLFSASRAQLVDEVIVPKLKEGFYVISDRFHDSSVAYQGFGRKLNLDFLITLQQFIIKSAVPDITFYLDLSIEEINERKAQIKNVELDRIEVSENNFYERVIEGYKYLADSEERFRVLDGMKTIEELHEEIIRKIEKFEKI